MRGKSTDNKDVYLVYTGSKGSRKHKKDYLSYSRVIEIKIGSRQHIISFKIRKLIEKLKSASKNHAKCKRIDGFFKKWN